jgi:hypothetical protein
MSARNLMRIKMPEFQLDEEPNLSGPIPGQSLTAEVGSQDWKSPPQHNTIEEALHFYIPRLTSDEFHSGLVNVLRMGIPVTTLANTLMLDGVMRGRHNVDVGILILPILMETIAYLGDMAEVEYIMGTETDETPQQNMLVETAKDMVAKELMRNRENTLTETDEEMVDVLEEEEEETMSEPTRAGLMGRVE